VNVNVNVTGTEIEIEIGKENAIAADQPPDRLQAPMSE
jgi:hypothetical protein